MLNIDLFFSTLLTFMALFRSFLKSDLLARHGQEVETNANSFYVLTLNINRVD